MLIAKESTEEYVCYVIATSVTASNPVCFRFRQFGKSKRQNGKIYISVNLDTRMAISSSSTLDLIGLRSNYIATDFGHYKTEIIVQIFRDFYLCPDARLYRVRRDEDAINLSLSQKDKGCLPSRHFH